MLEHGGLITQASEQFGIATHEWLDLSTGINPVSWPLTKIPDSAWSRLPENNDALIKNAKQYYRCEQLLPVAGSQAAIQLLPQLLSPTRIGMLEPAYSEHAHAWKRHGHTIIHLDHNDPVSALDDIDQLLVINPNNPTGHYYPPELLLQWHVRLSDKGGWLIVDEAFMDTTPENSLSGYSHLPGLVVLRSLGKFFGLAGARVGFVLAQQRLLDELSEYAGPWTVTGPSRYIANQALLDKEWQSSTRLRLIEDGKKLKQLLTDYKLRPDGGSSLFQWVKHPHAEKIKDFLAKQAILIRSFNAPRSLRFGLPGNEMEWRRLQLALKNLPDELFA